MALTSFLDVWWSRQFKTASKLMHLFINPEEKVTSALFVLRARGRRALPAAHTGMLNTHTLQIRSL